MQVLEAAWWLGVALLLAAGALRLVAIQRLKSRHASRLRELERPSLLPIAILPGSAEGERLLWNRVLGDRFNDKILNRVVVYFRLFTMLFIVLLTLMVAFWAYVRLTSGAG